MVTSPTYLGSFSSEISATLLELNIELIERADEQDDIAPEIMVSKISFGLSMKRRNPA